MQNRNICPNLRSSIELSIYRFYNFHTLRVLSTTHQGKATQGKFFEIFQENAHKTAFQMSCG